MRCSMSRTAVRYSSSLRRSVAPSLPLQVAGVLADEVEDALAAGVALGPVGVLAGAEEALEDEPRVDLLGQRRRRRAPGDGRGVGAASSRESQLPAIAPGSQPSSSDGEPGLVADAGGGDLVDRDAGADVGAVGLARLAAGQERGQGAGVVAGAVAVGPGLVGRQAGEDEQVVLDRRRAARGSRGSSTVGALGLRRPVGHVDAVGDVEEGHAVGRRLARRRRRRPTRSAGPSPPATAGRRAVPEAACSDASGAEACDRQVDCVMARLVLALPAPHLERVALDDREHQGARTGSRPSPAPPRSCRRRGGRSTPGRGPGRRSASSRPGSGRTGPSCPCRIAFSSAGPLNVCAAGQRRRTGRSGTSPSFVRQAPMASKFSKREAERVHPGVAGGAAPGWPRCCSIRCRSEPVSDRLAVLVQLGHVGRRRGRRRAEDLLQHPLAALHRRGPRRVRGHRQDARLRQHAAAVAAGRQLDADELVAADRLAAGLAGFWPPVAVGVAMP